MSIQMACPFCERPHKVDNKYAGKRILCKRCGKAIRVPGAKPAGAAPVAAKSAAAAAPAAAAPVERAPVEQTQVGQAPVGLAPGEQTPVERVEVKPVEAAKMEARAEPAVEPAAPASPPFEPAPENPAAAIPPVPRVSEFAPEFVSPPETKPADTAEAESSKERVSQIAAPAPEAELPAPLPAMTVAPEAIASPPEMPVETSTETRPKEHGPEIAAESPMPETPAADAVRIDAIPPAAAPPVMPPPEASAPPALEMDEPTPMDLPAAVDAARSLVAAMPEGQSEPEEPAAEVAAPVAEAHAVEAPTAVEMALTATTPPTEGAILEPVPEAASAEIVPSGAMMLTVPAHVLPTTEHVPGDSPTGLAGRRAMGPAQGPGAIYLKEIMLHLNQTVGRVARVFHESIPSNTPIDLQVVVPSNYGTREAHPRGNSFFTVVTSGLSNQPMNLPAGAPASMSRYAELMVCLPMTWLGMTMDGLFDVDLMRDEKNWWPMRWLKAAARMPHEHNTFLAPGHMIPNGPAAAPVAPNTRLGGMLVMPSEIHPKSHRLVVNENVAIDFYALWPIYPEEYQLRQDKGLDTLLELLASSGVTELVQLRRKNVAASP